LFVQSRSPKPEGRLLHDTFECSIQPRIQLFRTDVEDEEHDDDEEDGAGQIKPTAKNLLPKPISGVFSTLHLFAMTPVFVHRQQWDERPKKRRKHGRKLNL
jgi:hypothetical protein